MRYETAFRTIAGRVEAERAHHLGLLALRGAGVLPRLTAALTGGVAGGPAAAYPVTAMGLRFRSPLGVAAGFDKDAGAVTGLAALGFGFVEVGTVTPRPQPGAPAPRLFRLPADRALVNRLGFNNDGADAIAARLARLRSRPSRLPPGFVIGVNIGRNRSTPDGAASGDYASAARVLAPVADYLVVNVSSPNTPGLRDLQSVERLRPVLAAVQEAVAGARVPVLVKIAPDLADADIDGIVALAVDMGLAGVVAANTTLRRSGVAIRARGRGHCRGRRAVRCATAGADPAHREPGRVGGRGPVGGDRRRRHRLRPRRPTGPGRRRGPGCGLYGFHLRRPALAPPGDRRAG